MPLRIFSGRRRRLETAGNTTLSAADEGKLDSAVVAALFEQHSDELLRFLVGVLRDHQLASDALQAAFTKMVERGHETSEESRKAWLFRVAYNEALVVRRRQKTAKNVLERIAWSADLYRIDDSLLRSESVALVRAAIDELPPEQQRVVRMRIYEEKTFAVIAEELKIPLGTALGRMRAALVKLRSKLNSE
jgi:RNA polymerase sigma-70 factor (ECF subfamily)